MTSIEIEYTLLDRIVRVEEESDFYAGNHVPIVWPMREITLENYEKLYSDEEG